ncbi:MULTISPECIES: AAA family ATPase [Microcystis]|jgi:SpoVK/Ycf46/Vps4 family AAA+-type ATPase|uniref:AAA ATPase, central region n=4 Tax=Microcystis TaxID=1125 RepID=A0A3G9JI25_MICVR|nr:MULTISPECIES: AAA family ATPase [Microcystis]MCA2663468.1 ATP-binding protein [Microcystis sp. M064S2]MCA2771243.1 ATP-binding protein [Microcystis sp. M122S2]MCA2815265.1 ATP-binding protein [Microcystis sp. M085S1]MCA2854483.1 ATP-binding protein [Microcystis sp. M065S1]TRT79002.1 MAG: ATP-binding protein [Microcystis aeruginosa Ma_AC_P_19900807_S299]TRT82192.1 MAG: ATP-binding protein [Microcystis flos-aquae Ma_QC_C_20070823_S18]TRU00998.1 MAG: ATP-binding protein [Microcystis flos-aqu
MMIAEKQLKRLFQAFKERDDVAFYRAAESLIADELAANHHALAQELQQVLGKQPLKQIPQNGLRLLPKDRRSGEDLVILEESSIDSTQIVFNQETKAKIERVLDEHRQRQKLAKYGYLPKTKLLFWGPPGCGKTFTAKYLAYELGLPVGLLRLSAVISSFLGDTASHLQRVFNLANTTPMVLLLDEVDAVGKNRDDPNDVGELKRVVNSLLQAMDSFDSSKSIVIAASNHQYLLDPALWRRFDDLIEFSLPTKTEREFYLQSLLNGVYFDGSLEYIAKNMSSLSYADIQRITIEAIKTMILEGREQLQSQDISEQLKAFKKASSEARTKTRIIV